MSAFIKKWILIVCAVAVWLYPFGLQSDDWILIGCFTAVLVCVLLIKRPVVCYAVALFGAIGLGIYTRDAFACYAPVLLFFAAYRSARAPAATRRTKYDPFYCLCLFSLAACGCVSLALALTSLWSAPYLTYYRETHFYLLIIYFLCMLWMLVLSFRNAGSLQKNKTAAVSAERLKWLFLFGVLACGPGPLLYILSSSLPIRRLDYPLFLLFLGVMLWDNALLRGYSFLPDLRMQEN